MSHPATIYSGDVVDRVNDEAAMNDYVYQHLRYYRSEKITNTLLRSDKRPNWVNISYLCNANTVPTFWILHHLEKESMKVQQEILPIVYFNADADFLTRMIHLRFPRLRQALTPMDDPFCPYYTSVEEYIDSIFTPYELEKILRVMRESSSREDYKTFHSKLQEKLIEDYTPDRLVPTLDVLIDAEKGPNTTYVPKSFQNLLWIIYICGQDQYNENTAAEEWREYAILTLAKMRIDPELIMDTSAAIKASTEFSTHISASIDMGWELSGYPLYKISDVALQEYFDRFTKVYIDRKLQENPNFSISPSHYTIWMRQTPLSTLQKYAKKAPIDILSKEIHSDVQQKWKNDDPDLLFFMCVQGIEAVHEKYRKTHQNITILHLTAMSMMLAPHLLQKGYTFSATQKAQLAVQLLISVERYLEEVDPETARHCLRVYDCLVDTAPDLQLPLIRLDRMHKKALTAEVNPEIKKQWLHALIQWCNTQLHTHIEYETWITSRNNTIQAKSLMQDLADTYSVYESLVQDVLLREPTAQVDYSINGLEY